MSKGGGSAPAPDPLIGQAAKSNVELGKRALSLYEKAYEEGKPARDAASKRANQIADQQLKISQENHDISKGHDQYQKGLFRPLERQIVGAAQEYDTEARREQQAGEAIAGVNSQFDQAKYAMMRNAASLGIDPNSGNYAAQARQMGLSRAVASAGAGNQARKDVELQGHARKMDAANLGRGLASNQATSAGVALSAGNNSVRNAGVENQLQQGATNQLGQGFSMAMQGNNAGAGIAGQEYNARMGAYQADQQASASGFGSALGALGTLGGAAIIASDKNKKKNKKPASTKKALAAVNKTPVQHWQYKKGVADGKKHIGPMAQDVQRTMGQETAPNGKAIDVISMMGVNLAATQELAKRVSRMEKAA